MEISMGITAFKNAMDIAKIIIASKADNKTKELVSDLQSSMSILHATYLAVQAQNESLSKIKDDLEKKLAKINNFKKEAKRYEPRELCLGVVVYAIKEENKGRDPMHYLCPNCYEDHRKSMLQLIARKLDGAYFECKNPQCKAVFINHDDRRMPFS